MSKLAKKYCIVILILAVLYNVLVFAIPYPHKSEAVFWVAWVFGLIALLVQPVIAYFGFNDTKTLKSKVYGWPIFRLGITYLIVQLLVTVLFLILGAFFEVPFWILAIVLVVLLGLTGIGLVSQDSYKKELERIEEKTSVNTSFINDLRTDSKILSQRSYRDDIHKKLVELHEEIQYSDPVSNQSLSQLEDDIQDKYELMKQHLVDGVYDLALAMIDDLLNLIKERNVRTKLEKKNTNY